MNTSFKDLVAPDSFSLNQSNNQLILLGSILALVNLSLMSFTILYWTNPAFHLSISGKPL